jgi:uncharacterized protein
MVSSGLGDLNAMTNGSENVADVPFSAAIEPAPASAEGDAGKDSSMTVGYPRPWGPWATMGWTLLCLAVMFVVQIAVLIIFVIVHVVVGSVTKLESLAASGNFLAVCTLASTPALVGLMALIIWLRGFPIREYLDLKWPSTRSLFLGMAGLAVVLISIDLTSYVLSRPLVPEVMVEFYRNSWPPLLVFAVVVLAPLGEETLFRGFFYKGIAASPAGPVTAIVVSTIIFALIHFQYDWYGVLGVAVMGLYLGIVRYGSSSLLLTMLIHAIANVVATAEVFLQLRWAG